MSQNTLIDLRREIKFIAYEVEYPYIKNWLMLNSAGFSKSFPERQVNNIYFDSSNLSAYYENLSGQSYRTKIRYRWYGSALLPDKGTLEVKQKKNCFGWKSRFEVPNSLIKKHYSWQESSCFLDKQLPLEGKLWINRFPIQVLINRYKREYFISFDNKVRVTIDTMQSVWDQLGKSLPNLHFKTNHPNLIIIEFKFDNRFRKYASDIMQGIPLRVGRYSKYVSGVRSLIMK